MFISKTLIYSYNQQRPQDIVQEQVLHHQQQKYILYMKFQLIEQPIY